MTAILDAATRVRLAARAELDRRNRLREQKAACEEDILSFVRYIWPVIEPARPLKEGWVLDLLCDVMMAVADGHLTRVCINVPPGSSKSTMLNVMFPAWLWGPGQRSSARFLSASYSTAVPERDNLRLGRVLNSVEYRTLWGEDNFRILREGAEIVENNKTGWKRVTSTSGSTTGHRGDFILCLPYDVTILTDAGWKPIGEIVERKLDLRIAGWSGHSVVWQEIEAHEKNPGRPLVAIRHTYGVLRCTEDHPVWVDGRGYVPARTIRRGDKLCLVRAMRTAEEVLAHPLLLSDMQGSRANGSGDGARDKALCGVRDAVLSTSGAPGAGGQWGDVQPGMLAQAEHGREQPRIPNWPGVGDMRRLRQRDDAEGRRSAAREDLFAEMRAGHEVEGGAKPACAETMRRVRRDVRSAQQELEILLSEVRRRRARQGDGGAAERALSNWSACASDRLDGGRRQAGSGTVRLLRNCVQAARQVGEILLLRMQARGPEKRGERRAKRSLHPWAGQLPLPAGLVAILSALDPRARRALLPAVRSIGGGGRRDPACASHRHDQGQSRPAQPDQSLPAVPRERASEAERADDLATAIVFDVEPIRDIPEFVYNVRVAPHHNYFADGVLTHNCDDLNNPYNVESESIRSATNRWVREVMPSRLNDMQESAIINLQQRTHGDDATNTIIEHFPDFQFVCIPMEFDPFRICSITLRRDEDGEPIDVWTDPRAVDEDGVLLEGLTTNSRGEPSLVPGSPMAQAEGEICWPELFPPEAVEKKKQELGPYAWSSQFNQIPGIRGGAIIRRDWWRLWAGDYPPLGTVVVALDTALEEGASNDYNACTAWGAFEGETGEPQYLLLHGWRARLPLAQLVERVTATCRERKADYLLIEHKTRGRDVHDEIQRLHTNAPWQTLLIKPEGDKVSRLNSVSHLFSGDVRRIPDGTYDDQGRPVYREHWSGGVVYAPDRDWADEILTEVAAFPYGQHDDYCFVAGTMIATRRGDVAIEAIQPGDQVMTPFGWASVSAAAQTGVKHVIQNLGLVGTPLHPVFTVERSYQPLYNVPGKQDIVGPTLCGLIRTILLSKSSSLESLIGEWEGNDDITSRSQKRMRAAATQRACMLRSGSSTTGNQFRAVMKSITVTGTLLISILKIWSAYRSTSIAECLRPARRVKRCWRTWKRSALSLLNGTRAKKAGNGIGASLQRLWKKPDSPAIAFASNVRRHSRPNSQKPGFAAAYAPSGSITGGSTRHWGIWSARNAEPSFVQRAGTEQNSVAPYVEVVLPKSDAPRAVPVFNITVDWPHCYYANGVLVHNCDTVSLSLSWVRKNGVILRKAEWDEQELERNRYRKPPRTPYAIGKSR